MISAYDFTGLLDYLFNPQFFVTIPAGETRVPFNVTLLNDDMSEANENFELVIVIPRLEVIYGFLRGRLHRAMITIVDDDNG